MTDENTASGEEATAKAAKEAEAQKAKEEAEKANAKKDPKDHIIDRMAKREAKLKQELEELEADRKVLNPSTDTPSVENLFNQRMEVEEKISEYVSKYPGFEEHREKIRKYAHDPSRKGIPIDEIIVGAVGAAEFIKIGAGLQKEASDDETNSKMGGGNLGTVRTVTQEQKRKEKFNQLPKFLQGSKKAYDEQFNNS